MPAAPLLGDAKADGIINSADVLFIAPYMAGISEVGSGPATQVNFTNAASVKDDGDVDIITIADALYVAQYLAGLRDQNFNFLRRCRTP